jgi:hypothetical protein
LIVEYFFLFFFSNIGIDNGIEDNFDLFEASGFDIGNTRTIGRKKICNANGIPVTHVFILVEVLDKNYYRAVIIRFERTK